MGCATGFWPFAAITGKRYRYIYLPLMTAIGGLVPAHVAMRRQRPHSGL